VNESSRRAFETALEQQLYHTSIHTYIHTVSGNAHCSFDWRAMLAATWCPTCARSSHPLGTARALLHSPASKRIALDMEPRTRCCLLLFAGYLALLWWVMFSCLSYQCAPCLPGTVSQRSPDNCCGICIPLCSEGLAPCEPCPDGMHRAVVAVTAATAASDQCCAPCVVP